MNRYKLHESKPTFKEVDPFMPHQRLKHKLKASTFGTTHDRTMVKGEIGYMLTRDWDDRQFAMTVAEMRDIYEPI